MRFGWRNRSVSVRTAEADVGGVELTVADAGKGSPKAIWPKCLR